MFNSLQFEKFIRSERIAKFVEFPRNCRNLEKSLFKNTKTRGQYKNEAPVVGPYC